MFDKEFTIPRNDKEQEAYDLGVKIAMIEQDIMTLDLEALNNKINYWETIQLLFDPTSYIRHSKKVHRIDQVIRILLKARHELEKLKK